ncbi:MAG: helix-turn-helix domain-containing protein [Plesiomonas shigelloides]
MGRLHSSNNKSWLKYLLPMGKNQKGVFALTPWCFYMYGVNGMFNLPKHMYTSFTLVLKKGERLIIVPDYRFHEVFIDGKVADGGTIECKIIGQNKKMESSTIRINLSQNDQVILIRDSFFGRKIESIINIPIIQNSSIRALLEDLLGLNVEVTETLHAIANIVFILTTKKHTGKTKCNPLAIITNAIIENYKEENFNLDKLTSTVLMSRRKVQYILSESGETFTSLINNARVDEMKKIISENPRVRLSELAKSIGMNNSYAASRLFYKHEKISIKDYKKKQNNTIKQQ